MAHASEVCVWFPVMKLDALKEELGRQNTTVEVALLAKLEELYEHTIPLDRRVAINAALAEQDRLAAEEAAIRKAENYRVSVLHVHWDDWSEYWKVERTVDLLLLARLLRKTLQIKHSDTAEVFATFLYDRVVISEAEYEALARAMRSGDIHVSGAYNLDFGPQMLTVTDLQERRWKTCSFKDISTAVYRADQKEGLTWKEAMGRLDKAMTGKWSSGTAFPSEPMED